MGFFISGEKDEIIENISLLETPSDDLTILIVGNFEQSIQNYLKWMKESTEYSPEWIFNHEKEIKDWIAEKSNNGWKIGYGYN